MSVSVIANYTQRVNDFSLDETQNLQALCFITHVRLPDL